jgi:hypothetical protein
VFEDAVTKLNLLQPEFVVSVGDLIEGYTRDEDRIYREWEEFNGFIDRLHMPFFYVPGNHDYTNEVQARIWEEKFGPSYYHFIYKDVLFLCLNSEEAMKGSNMGGIEKPQYEYIRSVLQEHQDIRWTLLFMHQPLWILDNTRYWKDVESLLADRKHTVFVGHHHHYVKYERNRNNYFMLATTGGISKLRGPNFGEFDHMVWVTMTEDGPVIANLLLEGIWDENVVTEELNEMINADRINIEPVFTEDGFEQGDFSLRITNDANYPMSTLLRFGDSHYLSPEIIEIRKIVPPNSVEILDIPIRAIHPSSAKQIRPIPLFAWYTYEYEDGREIQLDQRLSMAPVWKKFLKKTPQKITPDGHLGDWPGFPYRGGIKSIIGEGLEEYRGDYDAHYEFNLVYDDENLYVGMAVWDDEVVTDDKKSVWEQDAFLVDIDPRPVLVSANNQADNRYWRDHFHLYASPSTGRNKSPVIVQEERLPEGTRLSTRKSMEGFNVEISIPLEYIRDMAGEEWQTLRVNVAYFDRDDNARRSSIWWKPNWYSPENYIGSGMFFRDPDPVE